MTVRMQNYNNNDKKMCINPAPFVFRNIIYLPLTREIMTEELGWEFSWNKKSGLKINTKDASRPIVFNPSEIENMGPWKYMEYNPYDYACEGNTYVGIENKESKVELNNTIIIKEKGKPARNIKLKKFGAIWLNNGAWDVKNELAQKGKVYPELKASKFTFVAVSTKDIDTKEIKKENLYLVTVDISNNKVTSKKCFNAKRILKFSIKYWIKVGAYMDFFNSDESNRNKDQIRVKLSEVINDYKFSLESLGMMSGIDMVWLKGYLNGENSYFDLSLEKSADLVDTVMMLSYGLPMISEDDRIKGVIDALVQIFKVSYETIALYTGLTIEDIEKFMENNLTSYEKKYKLATTTMMLHYLFKQPKKVINENEL